jgi:hypothetical protein
MIVHYITDLFISQSKVTNVQACLIENDGKPLQQPTGDEEDKRQEITRRYWWWHPAHTNELNITMPYWKLWNIK